MWLGQARRPLFVRRKTHQIQESHPCYRQARPASFYRQTESRSCYQQRRPPFVRPNRRTTKSRSHARAIAGSVVLRSFVQLAQHTKSRSRPRLVVLCSFFQLARPTRPRSRDRAIVRLSRASAIGSVVVGSFVQLAERTRSRSRFRSRAHVAWCRLRPSPRSPAVPAPPLSVKPRAFLF